MSKRDFEAVAAVLKANPDGDRETIARELAVVFGKRYPRFDAGRFLDAAGVDVP